MWDNNQIIKNHFLIFTFILGYSVVVIGQMKEGEISIKLYDSEKRQFLSGFSLVPNCYGRIEEPYHNLKNRKVIFETKDSVLEVNRIDLFSSINEETCAPYRLGVVIMRNSKEFYFYEMNVTTLDTVYLVSEGKLIDDLDFLDDDSK